MATRVSEGQFSKALSESLEGFPFKSLKPEQRECIRRLICVKEDVLAILPTGFGKSLIYQLLPKVLEQLHKDETGTVQFVVIVVSPLDYIRQQQVCNLTKSNCGVTAVAIGESEEKDQGISEGKFNVVYGSAEQWLSERWKKSMQFGGLHKAKVLVVDEVHTVETWGVGKKGKAAFREAFGRVSDMRSFLPSGTPVLGLTATANKEMRERLAKHLCLKSSIPPIVVSPNKDNIRFTVLQADKQLHCFDWLISLLLEKKAETPFTIIFCKTVNDIVSLLTFFLMKLGSSGVYVDGEGPAHERCLLGVYYSQTPRSHKDSVTSSFEGSSGQVRVVIASTSLSMGVDFPHVRYVIHYGPSRSLTSHLQEAGRAGRDGEQAYHLTLFHGRHLTTCEKDIRAAVRKSVNSCCRCAYLEGFDDQVCPLEPLHDCCSVCQKDCKCMDGGSGCCREVPDFDYLPTNADDHAGPTRNVSEGEKDCLHKALKEVQPSLSGQSKLTMFDNSGILGHGLSDEMIDTVTSNVQTIFTVYDLMEFCSASSLKIAVILLEIINDIFEDVLIPDELYSLVSRKESLSVRNKLTASIPPATANFDEFRCEESDPCDSI